MISRMPITANMRMTTIVSAISVASLRLDNTQSIELEHVERRGQKQEIDEKAQHADDHQGPAHVGKDKL